MKPNTVETLRHEYRDRAASEIKKFHKKHLRKNEYKRQLEQTVDMDKKFDKEHHLT